MSSKSPEITQRAILTKFQAPNSETSEPERSTSIPRFPDSIQKSSRRLWRSRRRKSMSIPGRGRFCKHQCSLPESAQTLAAIACRASGKSNDFPAASKFLARKSTVCILGALYRQGVLQGAFVKIGDFIKFKGFLVYFLENRRS